MKIYLHNVRAKIKYKAKPYMKFLLGEKVNMTQFFAEDGKVYAATVLVAGPVVVTQIKTKEKDGYSAVQVGFGTAKKKNINKAQVGHAKGLGDFQLFREFLVSEEEGGKFKIGDKVDVSIFENGDAIVVSGTSKGKGFQGVVKRHGFGGGRRSHGQKHSEREPGSIGVGGVQRVIKGRKMAGRMGGDRITIKNLKVLSRNPESNELIIKGAIPGRRGSLVEIVSM